MRIEHLPPGVTPRLLSRQAAAAYCGVSPGVFETHVPIAPVRVGHQKRWDVKALDAWLDRQSGFATIAVPDGEERWDG
jgi:hypothetical protein